MAFIALDGSPTRGSSGVAILGRYQQEGLLSDGLKTRGHHGCEFPIQLALFPLTYAIDASVVTDYRSMDCIKMLWQSQGSSLRLSKYGLLNLRRFWHLMVGTLSVRKFTESKRRMDFNLRILKKETSTFRQKSGTIRAVNERYGKFKHDRTYEAGRGACTQFRPWGLQGVRTFSESHLVQQAF